MATETITDVMEKLGKMEEQNQLAILTEVNNHG